MKKIYFAALCAIMFSYISLTGFECASTELTSAKLYIKQNNFDKAIESLEKEVARNPKSEEGFFLLGTMYGEKGDFNQMQKYFASSISAGKKFEKEIRDRKKSYWSNNFNKGVGFYNKGVQAKSDSAKTFFDKSIEAFNVAILLEPDSADSYRNLTYIYLNSNRFDDAIPVIKKWMDLKHDKDSYKFLGEIYIDKGNSAKEAKDSVTALSHYETAISYLEEGRKRYPSETEILTNLSNAYIQANKSAVAKETFRDLVEKDPENKNYRYNYGVVLLGSDEFAEAETQFKEALKTDPEYLNALYNLSVTYVKWGVVLQKKADEAGKDDPQAKAKFSAALPHLENYVQKKSDDAVVIELLGKVYSRLGMTNDATKMFEKADALRNKK